MYTYRKLKAVSTDCPDRFYRVMYVRDDLNLQDISFTILTAFRCEFEHMWLLRDKEHLFVDETWLEDGFYHTPEYIDYKKAHLNDLVLNSYNAFTLEYDTGEGWRFTVRLLKDEKQFGEDTDTWGIVTQAKGDRIWEDNHYAFWNYLNGKELYDEAEEHMPWNIPDDRPIWFFDAPVDLEELNGDLEDAQYLLQNMEGDRKHP